MAEEKKSKGWSLAKTFLKVAGIGLSLAFGFYVMGALDFTMFHEMAEGVAFMDRAGPVATDILRADIPIAGFSIADTFTTMASWFPVPGTSETAMAANDAMLSSAVGGTGTQAAVPMVASDW